MSTSDNYFQTVTTYNQAGLAKFINSNCFVSTCNTKYKQLQNVPNNLGSSISFDRQSQFLSGRGLVAQFQPIVENVETMTVNSSANVSYAYTAQQLIFNLDDWLDGFGEDAVMELSATVESNVAKNADSSANADDGSVNPLSGPFRFYGNGSTLINSIAQLSEVKTRFMDLSAAKGNMKMYIPLTVEPQIVNSMMNQFVLKRNEDDAMSWEIGNWAGIDMYRSNALPKHISGTVGQAQTTLTLVSVNDPTGANVTQLTFSGASASDASAIKAGDLASFQWGVSGETDLFMLTYTGHFESNQPVQFRAKYDAASDVSGNVVVDVYPPLVWKSDNAKKNLSSPLSPGMQVKFITSHQCGLLVTGNAFFLGMPELPDQYPFPTDNTTDEDTKVSIRTTYGTRYGENFQGLVHDCIWASHLVPWYAMRIAFPLNQGS